MYKFLVALLFPFFAGSSIYDFTIKDGSGGDISLSAFRGRKLLLVNIATQSPRAGQLAELTQLQGQYMDSLVVIAFPSNSFGNEPRSDAGIQQFCQAAYQVNFRVAAAGEVTGGQVQPVYQWLATAALNGQVSIPVHHDYQKVLVDGDGRLIGIFAGSVSPLDSLVRRALEGE